MGDDGVDKEERLPGDEIFDKEYADFIIRVGLKIAYYRKAGGMTQQELAEASKLSVVFISQMEGKNFAYAPSLKSLLKIAKVLGVNAYKFIDVEDD